MAATVRRGPLVLLKKYWNEQPELVGSGAMGILGLGLLIWGGFKYYEKDGNNRRYRGHYIVLRHDDPAVQKLKISCDVTSRS
ncbi:uncharacterized protein LOC109533122 [Dendroctonus ponderosae]|uniref:NADH dehydrogenase [ubiquinone] 1 alpha subcomplex subunit 13 n=1 Tax=Dendroctonus ponderosae TaxID=77166 RepID=A0AAR5NY85_DENPD|nr:uncharacterized protein LOC109533122 [Dendroctonus ponderosae]KAH1002011.1 hypothetical protein HUJ04_005956 [Dendroctonus ponderosae]KAH1004982.1 hypothetical protein HUJ05_005741 [Dendroctonus ponderosae]